MMRRLLLTILLTTAALGIRAQLLAVSTELTSDVMLAPSLGLELVTANHSTLSLNAVYGERILGKNNRVVALQPEYRYYFSGRTISKWFVGVGAIGTSYEIHTRGKVYDGYAAGVGLTFGYVWNLTKRLSLDFHSGFGGVFYKRKEYFEQDNYDIDYLEDGYQRTNAKGYYLMPTRIGISISYIIK